MGKEGEGDWGERREEMGKEKGRRGEGERKQKVEERRLGRRSSDRSHSENLVARLTQNL